MEHRIRSAVRQPCWKKQKQLARWLRVGGNPNEPLYTVPGTAKNLRWSDPPNGWKIMLPYCNKILLFILIQMNMEGDFWTQAALTHWRAWWMKWQKIFGI